MCEYFYLGRNVARCSNPILSPIGGFHDAHRCAHVRCARLAAQTSGVRHGIRFSNPGIAARGIGGGGVIGVFTFRFILLFLNCGLTPWPHWRIVSVGFLFANLFVLFQLVLIIVKDPGNI